MAGDKGAWPGTETRWRKTKVRRRVPAPGGETAPAPAFGKKVLAMGGDMW